MPVISTPAVDKIVSDAKSLPQLVSSLEKTDPALAASLESKPLIASKTPLGTLGATVAAYVSTRYGLGWDETTCGLVSGVALLAMSYIMRYLSPQYISGLFKTPAAPASVPNPPTPQ